MQLPEATKLSNKKEMNPVKLIVSASGRMLLNKRALTMKDLPAELGRLHRASPTRGIFLNIDSKVPYRNVRPILKIVQDIGIKGVSLKVQPKKKAEEG